MKLCATKPLGSKIYRATRKKSSTKSRGAKEKIRSRRKSLKSLNLKLSKEIEIEKKDSLEFDQFWNQIYIPHTFKSEETKIQIVDRNGEILYKWG